MSFEIFGKISSPHGTILDQETSGLFDLVGGNTGIYEGAVVGARAVIGAGTILTGSTPVYDLPQALDNPFAHAVGMVRPLPHPARPDFRVLANPIKLDGERLPSRRAPALGEHTDEVLRSAGFSDAELAALRAAGAS